MVAEKHRFIAARQNSKYNKMFIQMKACTENYWKQNAQQTKTNWTVNCWLPSFFYFLGDPSCFLDAVSVVSNQHPLLYFTCFPPLSSIFTSYPMLMFQAFPTITTFCSYFLSIIPATMLFSHEKQLSPPSIITRSHVNYAFFPFFFFPYNFLISNWYKNICLLTIFAFWCYIFP